ISRRSTSTSSARRRPRSCSAWACSVRSPRAAGWSRGPPTCKPSSSRRWRACSPSSRRWSRSASRRRSPWSSRSPSRPSPGSCHAQARGSLRARRPSGLPTRAGGELSSREGPALRILKSALFWRILLSSLLVVAVLGVGLFRANSAHEELEKQFERLVQHDLKLADDDEQLLRLMVDLETGKRGYLLTGDRSFLAPYEQARRELDGLLTEAQDVAENGMEDERVAAFGRLLHDWIQNVSEPQILARQKGDVPDPGVADEGKSRTDEMRGLLSDLRRHALDDADERQQAAFDSAGALQRATRTVLLLAIIIALGSGAWIARDIAGTTAQLEGALGAPGRLETLPPLPTRRDELGAVARSLAKMHALLLEKDASLRATLADRERALAELTQANAALALRDARARAYAEFVRELKALDVGALATGGLQTLVRLADAQVGTVYLLDGENNLVPVQATASDGRIIDRLAFGSDGLPKSVMDRREPVFLSSDTLGEPLPNLDLGIGSAPLRWVLAYPVALGDEGVGAIGLGRMHYAS